MRVGNRRFARVTGSDAILDVVVDDGRAVSAGTSSPHRRPRHSAAPARG
jgi:hypothetical protein